MPDFSMCSWEWCQEKETCYRYKAIPSMRQTWANFYQECENWVCLSKIELWNH